MSLKILRLLTPGLHCTVLVMFPFSATNRSTKVEGLGHELLFHGIYSCIRNSAIRKSLLVSSSISILTANPTQT
jgi:hypothetical protein